MKYQSTDTSELPFDSQEDTFDLKKWLFQMLRVWPWFLLCMILAGGAAYSYLRYANPEYSAVASLMIKDEKKGGAVMDNTVLKELGIGASSKLVENETEILKSYDLMDTVVRRLGLYTSITRKGRIRNVPVFQNEVPFSLEILNPDTIKYQRVWIFTPGKNGFLFKTTADGIEQSLTYGHVYKTDRIFFRCMPTHGFQQSDMRTKPDTIRDVYEANLQVVEKTSVAFAKRLKIDPVSKVASVINLGITDNNEKRATAILETLIDFYNKQGLLDKNKVTENTIDFLNERLINVANELQHVEGDVEKFKTQNKITDISADAQQYLTLSQQIDIQKAQSETQMNIVNALERDLLLNQDNPQLMPSTFGIQEPSLASLIERHNELVLQKERTMQKSGPQNPLLIDLQDQIKEIRSKMLSNVRSLKKAYDISLMDVSRKDELLNNRIRNVPLLEKKLVQIKRDQNVQEQLYAFLLQKREESALTLASTIEDSRTIVRARSLGVISPKKMIIWGLAFITGLAIPIGVFSLRDFLNTTVGDREQILEKTEIPIIGSLSHVKKMKSPLVINGMSRTVAAEQIRNVRTAINFASKSKEVKTILITSFQPGDGKSFISMNIAASYALLKKKTVLLEFDLRKPNISKSLGIEQEKGISSVLTGKSDVSELLVPVEGYEENLYVLPAGYLPPNPAELILSKNMSCLIKNLNDHFDYVIIDTPPFSLVTDAALLQQYTDITIVVLRQGHTSKEVYPELNQYRKKHADCLLYILINDLGKKKQYQNSYTNYKKGYGAGYYDE